MDLKLNRDQIEAMLAEVFPQVEDYFSIDAVEPYRAVATLEPQHRHLRPGGTVSGPSMFELADLAFYVATLALVGPEALAVTTNANINFMRKPSPGKLSAEARILKLGKRLSVGDVLIYSEGVDKPVAHATLTYSIPPS